jgi:hypothetical protein
VRNSPRRRLRRSKRRGHLPDRRQEPPSHGFGGPSLPGAPFVLAPGAARAGAGWPALGSLRSAVRLRRVHSARTRHATAKPPCHAGCYALRSRNAVETCPQAPACPAEASARRRKRKWGAREHVSFSIWAGLDRFPLACVDTLCYGVVRLQPMRRVISARSDKRK